MTVNVPAPEYFSFGIIIDDIVFPDGRTAMGSLGGGGPQTVFGMRLWTDDSLVGLIADVGPDMPEEGMAWLKQSGIDESGISFVQVPTPRSWQVLEEDGRRSHVWRISESAIQQFMSSKNFDRIPDHYRRAKGFHHGIHVLHPGIEFMRRLKQHGIMVSVESFNNSPRPLSQGELSELLSVSDIFSPNLSEAYSILGHQANPEAIIAEFLRSGANVVVLRMGKDGAVVACRGEKYYAYIPPLLRQAVNPIGAGNAFCGGFLVSWVISHDLAISGLSGAIASGMLLNQLQMPMVTQAIQDEAKDTLHKMLPSVKYHSL